jgi:hypothetical protein
MYQEMGQIEPIKPRTTDVNLHIMACRVFASTNLQTKSAILGPWCNNRLRFFYLDSNKFNGTMI